MDFRLLAELVGLAILTLAAWLALQHNSALLLVLAKELRDQLRRLADLLERRRGR